MLRTGRPNILSKRSSIGLNAESVSSDDLEDASLPRISPPSNRPQSALTWTALFKTIGIVTLITFLAFALSRPRGRTAVSGKDEVQWKPHQGELERNITSQRRLDKPSSAPIGKPLSISSLSHPPRIDRSKLFTQLAKLESECSDDDVNNEDTDEVADDLRLAFGLSRWPPLITHVPSALNHSHEEYTVEVADILFCTTVPCKVLVPAWARPLSPTQQIAQIQYLVHVARHLNRTLVLPNAGHSSNEAGEILLGIGTCHRYPFARYFDVSRLLFQIDRDNAIRPAVAMQPFLEWVKYRPVHPSAQVVVVNSIPSNDTDEAIFIANDVEMRIDEQAEKGRGKHRNCLSSRASKLKFGGSAPFVISPYCDKDAERSCEAAHKTNPAYLEGLLTALSGQIGDPDVLVIEWAFGSNHPSLLNAIKDDEDILLDYSSRLYALASRINSTLPRPLIVLQSQPVSSKSWTGSASTNLSGIAKELADYIENFTKPPKTDDYVPKEKASEGDAELNISEFAETLEAASMDATGLSNLAQGTVWLGRGILPRRNASSLSETRSSYGLLTNLEDICKPSEQDPPGALLSRDAFLSSEVFEDLFLTDVQSALSNFGLQTTKSYAELGALGLLEDDVAQAIVGEIIERHADRVFLVGSGC